MGMENFGSSLGQTARDLLQNWKEWDHGMTENIQKKNSGSENLLPIFSHAGFCLFSNSRCGQITL